MMTPDDVGMTPGEIGRHLGRIEATLTAGFAEIKADLDKYVLKSVHEAEMRSVNDRFRDVEKDLEQSLARQRAVLALTIPALLTLAGLMVALWNSQH